MRIAALLVNYRDAAGTAAAAQSVVDDDPAAEIIVVDNSDDEAQWQALRSALPPSARAVRAEANLGFGRGCNLALRHSGAPLLMLVNPDVRLRRGCLDALRAALHNDPGLGAVGPRQFLDEEGDWLLPPAWLPTSMRAWATEKVMRRPERQPRWARAIRAESLRCWTSDGVVRQRALSGAAMMVRRSALEDAQQVFDPRFFMYFEDSDLCMRLRRRGWRMALVAGARAVHAWRNAPHKGALMAEGMARYFAKHAAADDVWRQRREALAEPAAWRHEPETLDGTTLVIGPAWSEGWCVEVSPHPHLWPSVGRLGHGTRSLDLGPVAEALCPGTAAHIRLSALGDEAMAQGRCRSWVASRNAP